MRIRDIRDVRDWLGAAQAHAIESSRAFVRQDGIEELLRAGRLVKRELPGGGHVVQIEKTMTREARAIDTDKRVISGVTLSTDDVDRFGDVIDQDGWDLENFQANPVMPLDHNYDIGALAGIWSDVKAAGGALTGNALFLPAGDRAADLAFGKIVGGALRAVSVGFRSLRWERIEDEWGDVTGFHFREMEKLESSWVVIPANPGALMSVEKLGPGAARGAPPPTPALLDRLDNRLAAAGILARLGRR